LIFSAFVKIKIRHIRIKLKKKGRKEMVKNGLIAMAVMIAAVAVSGGLIMSQQNVKYNNDMTGMERLLYDESYKAWLENFDVSSFDIRKVKNADSMFQLQKK
jgi:predicted nucleic acid-binding protein